ncbi:MAG TPA: hypothetical protein VFF74_10910, partial [Methylophilaceae bacterium]|nr:hypothetical protein [Methylophilaceae bacterium]
LEAVPDLPPYLKSLTHYEWIELALAVVDISIDLQTVKPAGDLLQGKPVLAPALALLSYDYAVQLISPRFKPLEPLAQPVHLLVFRDTEDNVRFIELNSITARLLHLLQEEDTTGLAALEKIAAELTHLEPHPKLQAVIEFGRAILDDLRQQGAILGVRDTGLRNSGVQNTAG